MSEGYGHSGRMTINTDAPDDNRNTVQTPPEPVWQTLAGCATLLLSLVALWWLW